MAKRGPYQWGRLGTPGILEVRNDMRGRGIDKALVEHCLALANREGEHILRIECKRSTSIPFWQSMGFVLTDSNDGRHKNYAVRLMQEKLELRAKATPSKLCSSGSLSVGTGMRRLGLPTADASPASC